MSSPITSKLVFPACLADQRRPGIILQEFTDKHLIYRQGDSLSWVGIIQQGYVKVHRLSAQGKQITLAFLGKNGLLGHIDRKRLVCEEAAVSQGKVSMLKIEADAFDALLAENAEFARFIAYSLSRYQDFLHRRLFSFVNHKVEPRIIAVLYDLFQGEGEACRHGGVLDVRLTQQDLADMVGASRQVVSSLLNRLREQRIIGYTRHFICMGNMKALADLKEELF